MDPQDHKLALHELLDSEHSTSSVHSYIEHIQQNLKETEWGAILRKLEEPSPMSAAEMIDDHLRPSSASVHNSADDDQIHTPPHIGMCPMMRSFDYMHYQQNTQFANNGDNQLEAQRLEMGRPNSSAVHIDCPRFSRSNTRASTPGNSTDHLDSVWDELLISYNDHSSSAQESQDYRHQQYYQNQQSFKGSNYTILTPDWSSAAHHDVSADYHEICHHTPCNTVLKRSNSATYDYYSHMNRSESGPCSPATSASSDEPVNMEESLISQTKLNTTNSTDQSSSLTMITELAHNQQQAHPKDELLDKKRGSKSHSRLKKTKKQRGPMVAIRMKSETDIVDDGFKWRKYGQKAVKNSPYPRSYYKCTDKRCNVRKHVERQTGEPDVVMTTYEGVHMHPTSSNRNNNESDSNGPNDLPHLYPPSHPNALHRPVSQYAYFNPLIAHHVASIYNNTYNYLPTHLFPLVHPNTPAHDTLDYQLRHHLLQLLTRDQGIMGRRSHSVQW